MKTLWVPTIAMLGFLLWFLAAAPVVAETLPTIQSGNNGGVFLVGANLMLSIGNTVTCVTGRGDWFLGALGVGCAAVSFSALLWDDHLSPLVPETAIVSAILGAWSISLDRRNRAEESKREAILTPVLLPDGGRGVGFGAMLRVNI
jgi:hypothetical protein